MKTTTASLQSWRHIHRVFTTSLRRVCGMEWSLSLLNATSRRVCARLNLWSLIACERIRFDLDRRYICVTGLDMVSRFFSRLIARCVVDLELKVKYIAWYIVAAFTVLRACVDMLRVSHQLCVCVCVCVSHRSGCRMRTRVPALVHPLPPLPPPFSCRRKTHLGKRETTKPTWARPPNSSPPALRGEETPAPKSSVDPLKPMELWST